MGLGRLAAARGESESEGDADGQRQEQFQKMARDLEQANGEVPVSLAFRGADGELLSIETRFALRQSAP